MWPRLLPAALGTQAGDTPTRGCSSSRWARVWHRRPTQADREDRSASATTGSSSGPAGKPAGDQKQLPVSGVLRAAQASPPVTNPRPPPRQRLGSKQGLAR